MSTSFFIDTAIGRGVDEIYSIFIPITTAFSEQHG
jgi:hypothetical protein